MAITIKDRIAEAIQNLETIKLLQNAKPDATLEDLKNYYESLKAEYAQHE